LPRGDMRGVSGISAKKPAQILYPAYRIKDAVMIVKINFLYNI
jgi:hypothetical protein